MEKVFLFAVVLTILFGILKVAITKWIENEMKPLKEIVRDLAIVFVSAFGTGYVFLQHGSRLDDFFSVITNQNLLNPDTTQIFTGIPDF
jgi:ABC-type Mn2+/Zn2+ transport system permease subunit